MKERSLFNNTPPSEELINRYKRYTAGESAGGYFDVEEVEMLADHFLQYNTEEAIRVIDMGLKQHPNHQDLMIGRIKILAEQGNLNEAMHLLNLLMNQECYEAQLVKIEILTKFNRVEEAKKIALNILAQPQEEPELTVLDISDIFRDCDQFETSLFILEQREKTNALSVDMLFEKAYCLEQIGNYQDAISTYQEIIKVDSYIGEAWFNLGQVYYTLQEYKDALHAYTMCVTINEDDTIAWIQKGHTHFFLKEIDNAHTCYTKCIDSYKDKWELYIFIAECFALKQEYEDAILYYKASLKERLDNHKAHIGLATCEIEMGNYPAATKLLQEAIKICPEAYEAWFYLGEIENRQQNIEQAITFYQKAYTLNDSDLIVAMTLGNIFANNRAYEQAIPYYHKAHENADELQRTEILILLATCYFYINNYDIALYHIEKAMKEDTNSLNLFYSLCPEGMEKISEIIKKTNDKQQNK